ncbi:hypothetical protein HDV57DRAFT_502113 [Trichoderma longibrachiatum]
MHRQHMFTYFLACVTGVLRGYRAIGHCGSAIMDLGISKSAKKSRRQHPFECISKQTQACLLKLGSWNGLWPLLVPVPSNHSCLSA